MKNDHDDSKPMSSDEKSLSKLMNLAGERAEIPITVESRVYHRVRQEWRNSTAEPSSEKVYEEVHRSWWRDTRLIPVLRWLVPSGVAAIAITAVILNVQTEPLQLQGVATVSKVIDGGPASSQFLPGATINAGDVVATDADEGLSLVLARGESLRIDANTRIRIDAADHFTLLRGRIYADTGQFVYRGGGLRIDTDLGVVTDVGTQFSVMTSDGSLEVSVREGRVDVQSETEAYATKMGERLTLLAGKEATVSDLDTHDESWNWVADLAPVFDLRNRSLLDFLKWAARETGRDLRFESDASRMSAMRTEPSGSIDGLSPNEALVAVLATTTLRYRISDKAVIIER